MRVVLADRVFGVIGEWCSSISSLRGIVGSFSEYLRRVYVRYEISHLVSVPPQADLRRHATADGPIVLTMGAEFAPAKSGEFSTSLQELGRRFRFRRFRCGRNGWARACEPTKCQIRGATITVLAAARMGPNWRGQLEPLRQGLMTASQGTTDRTGDLELSSVVSEVWF